MKQKKLNRFLVLLLGLLTMCVTQVWAEDINIYTNDGAIGTANGVTAAGNVNTNAKNGNPGNSFANTSSSNTTFTFSGFNVSSYSNLKLTLDVNFSQFPSTVTTYPSITVTAYKNESEVFQDATTIAVNSKTTGYNSYTVNISTDFDKIILTSVPSTGKTAKGAASTVYSAYMDNIKIVGTQSTGPTTYTASVTPAPDNGSIK